MVAVAVLDNQVMPEQDQPQRIQAQDVQTLLRKVVVRPLQTYSRRFPDEIPCRLTVVLNDGRVLVKEKRDYEGFHTRPAQWETVVHKFERLNTPYTDASLRGEIIDAVAALDTISVAELIRLLAQVHIPIVGNRSHRTA